VVCESVGWRSEVDSEASDGDGRKQFYDGEVVLRRGSGSATGEVILRRRWGSATKIEFCDRDSWETETSFVG
jgi:hypothetical protein